MEVFTEPADGADLDTQALTTKLLSARQLVKTRYSGNMLDFVLVHLGMMREYLNYVGCKKQRSTDADDEAVLKHFETFIACTKTVAKLSNDAKKESHEGESDALKSSLGNMFQLDQVFDVLQSEILATPPRSLSLSLSRFANGILSALKGLETATKKFTAMDENSWKKGIEAETDIRKIVQVGLPVFEEQTEGTAVKKCIKAVEEASVLVPDGPMKTPPLPNLPATCFCQQCQALKDLSTFEDTFKATMKLASDASCAEIKNSRSAANKFLPYAKAFYAEGVMTYALSKKTVSQGSRCMVDAQVQAIASKSIDEDLVHKGLYSAAQKLVEPTAHATK